MNNYDLSVLIPARNEMFVALTVKTILDNIRGNTEVIVALDGEWACPGIPDDPRVTIVYFPEAIGQRAATNQACRLSRAKYVMKIDAHCAVDEGFDVKMLSDMQEDMTLIPTMYNLHAFNWKCLKCKKTWYQSPTPQFCCKDGDGKIRNEQCDSKQFEREIVWKPRLNKKSLYYRFDKNLHFQYWGDFRNRPGAQGNLVEIMSTQGSCFMISRKRYWELNICDEKTGSWGQQGVEVACKTWLSGGKLIVTKKTWYSHMFRTQGGDFGFPYSMSGADQEKAREYSKKMWFGNTFNKQIHPLSWLIEKFKPVPDFHDSKGKEILDMVNQFGAIFSRTHSFADSANSFSGTSNNSTISHKMPSPAMGSSSSESVLGMGNQAQMDRVTTSPVIADKMIQLKTSINRNGSNEPSVNKTMDPISLSIPSSIKESTVSAFVKSSNPIPTSGNFVKNDLRENSINGNNIEFINSEKIGHGNIVPKNMEINNTLKKGIIFFTDNQLNTKIAHAVQKQLISIGLPIISSSLKPMPHFGKNIYLPLQRGYLTMFKQILAALEASDADIIYFCEHDVLYHPSHFEFVPEKKDIFYYNVNWYKVRSTDGYAVSWEANQVSGLCAYRQVLLDHYRKVVSIVERFGYNHSMGFEPGSHNDKETILTRDKSKIPEDVYVDDILREEWKSKYPNVDFRTGANLSKSKWTLNDFRDKTTAKNFKISSVDNIPGWDSNVLRNILQLH